MDNNNTMTTKASTTAAAADTVETDTNDFNKSSSITSTPQEEPLTLHNPPPGTPTEEGHLSFSELILNTRITKPPIPRGITISTKFRIRSRSIETAVIQNNRNKTMISTLRKYSHGNDRVSGEASKVPR